MFYFRAVEALGGSSSTFIWPEKMEEGEVGKMVGIQEKEVGARELLVKKLLEEDRMLSTLFVRPGDTVAGKTCVQGKVFVEFPLKFQIISAKFLKFSFLRTLHQKTNHKIYTEQKVVVIINISTYF